jgi:UDP-glucose 4-epimerase
LGGTDRILVTGGAGYVGSHAAKALRRAGHEVVVYDDLSAGHRGAVLGDRLIEGNIADVDAVRRAIRETEATVVMHFAAWLVVPDSVKDPAGYYRNNVIGTLGTLEAMAAERCRHFVFSSTCAVYGEPTETPLRESHPTNPINAYGQSKLAIEHALPHFERAYGIRSIRLRYFNAAGADPDGRAGEDHDPETHLIPLAIGAAMGSRPPLTVFGTDYETPDGTCIRDYVHVSDLADAHLRVLPLLDHHSVRYNLGNGTGYSVKQVLETVGRLAATPVPHTVGPRREGDPASLVASSAKLRAETGWSPRFPNLDDIVRTAWAWHSAHPKGYAEVT